MDHTDPQLNQAEAPVPDLAGCGDVQIIFLVQRALSQRDYVRNGIAELRDRGAQITVIDVGDLVQSKFNHRREHYADFDDINLEVVSTPRELQRLTQKLKQADLVVCHVGSGFVTAQNLGVLRWLSRTDVPYLLFSIDAAPNIVKALRKRGLGSRLRAADHMTSLLNRLPNTLLGVRPADFIVYSGTASQVPRKLVTESTKACWSTSRDYQLYLEERRKVKDTEQDPEGDKIAVFLDQNLGFHTDLARKGNQEIFDPEGLYPTLRQFFECLEKELGVTVVIAAHPRADYSKEPDIFGSREIVYGESAELVASCALVICSFSTSISFPVLFRKPILIYATDAILSHPRVGNAPISLSQAIGTTVCNIDYPDDYSLEGAFQVSDEMYDDYTDRYIRLRQTEALSPTEAILACANSGASSQAESRAGSSAVAG